MMAAPDAVKLAGLMLTVAIPLASVSAVAAVGVIFPIDALVVKVTTMPGITTPETFFTVAFTVVGEVPDKTVAAAPSESAKAKVMLAGSAAGTTEKPVVLVTSRTPT